MKVYALWHGGSSYAVGSIPEDVEVFDSLREARSIFQRRHDSGSWDGTPLSTPCVDDSSTMWIFFADPSDSNDPYPDRVFSFGLRGGIVESTG